MKAADVEALVVDLKNPRAFIRGKAVDKLLHIRDEWAIPILFNLVKDETDFINKFMAMKDDGHVRFHSAAELGSLFKPAGFSLEKQFSSSITFPREMNSNYERLIAQTPGDILQAYQLRIEENQVYLTIEVLNSCFRVSSQ